MKVVRIVFSTLLVFGFTSVLVIAVEGPKAEIEKEIFDRPLVLKPKIPSYWNPGPPPIKLPPVIKVGDDGLGGELNSMKTDRKQLGSTTETLSGSSMPMMNTSVGASPVERLKGKIERVIKKLDL